MSIHKSHHYGVEISLHIDAFPGCCGARILRNLGAGGGVSSLTKKQKHAMYQELFNKVLEDSPGTIVAVDCVMNFGDWSDLGRDSSSWKQSDSAGDISTEDFCEWAGFTRTAVARNANSGNLVACFSLATRQVSEDSPEEVEVIEGSKPDFSDEVKKPVKVPANLEEVIKQVNAILEGSN